ncbi:helix-turn-helix domain-containing protein [Oscillospiraceae bacterium HV4-5-C5C]|nr:helix-turn-helix domain-containing protein [Oscillospiraceae bacterium HV4-5-C5C]
MTQYTHIELAEREQIQKALGAGQTIAAIARSLSRDPKSIAHEIKTNRQAIFKVRSPCIEWTGAASRVEPTTIF